MIARYGADATRLYTLFGGPPDRDLDWQDAGVEGVQRFLSRVYRLVARNVGRPSAEKLGDTLSSGARNLQRKLHQTIKRITDDFSGRWHFNTSISAIMELVNGAYVAEQEIAGTKLMAEVQRTLALMLAPLAPYLAHELWEMIGEKSNLLREAWPKYDPSLAKEEEIEIPVQINGKLRSRILVPAGTADEAVRALALADEKVRASLDGKQVVKAIVVPGKLVNLVVR